MMGETLRGTLGGFGSRKGRGPQGLATTDPKQRSVSVPIFNHVHDT